MGQAKTQKHTRKEKLTISPSKAVELNECVDNIPLLDTRMDNTLLEHCTAGFYVCIHTCIEFYVYIYTKSEMNALNIFRGKKAQSDRGGSSAQVFL